MHYLELTWIKNALKWPLRVLARVRNLKKLKNTKVKQTSEKCVTCSKDIKQNATECFWCQKWVRASINLNECNILGNSSKNIMFFCTLCFSKVPFALKLDSEVTTKSQE